MRSLQMTVAALPDLLPRVQELLLDLLSLVLARRPFSPATPPVTLQSLQAAIASGEPRGAAGQLGKGSCGSAEESRSHCVRVLYHACCRLFGCFVTWPGSHGAGPRVFGQGPGAGQGGMGDVDWRPLQ